jgi:hypothetical protein
LTIPSCKTRALAVAAIDSSMYLNSREYPNPID